MRAAIREFFSPDVSGLEGWIPPDPTCFGILLQVFIGPLGGQGYESFDFVVCTPEWLRRKYGDDGVILCRHYILVFEFNLKRIAARIESLVASVEGGDWNEIASKLARYGHWEFEDYTEAPSE